MQPIADPQSILEDADIFAETKEWVNARLIPALRWRECSEVLGHQLRGHWAIYMAREWNTAERKHEDKMVLAKIRKAIPGNLKVGYRYVSRHKAYIVPEHVPLGDYWPTWSGSLVSGWRPVARRVATMALYRALSEVEAEPWAQDLYE